MIKYYIVAHTGVTSIPKSKELTSYGLYVLIDRFVHWKYEDSWFTDEHGEYFHNENLNIDKLYLTDEDADNEIIINNLFNNLYDFYTNKLENDKYLDIGDYDIIIKEDTNYDEYRRIGYRLKPMKQKARINNGNAIFNGIDKYYF